MAQEAVAAIVTAGTASAAHDEETTQTILISTSTDETAKAWNLRTGHWIATYVGHQGSVEAAALDCDGSTLITGGSDGYVRTWELMTGRSIASLRSHVGRITSLCIPRPPPPPPPEAPPIPETDLPRPKSVVTASDDTTCKYVDMTSRGVLSIMKAEAPIACVVYSFPHVFLSCTNGHILVFHAASGQPKAKLRGHTDAVNAIAVAGDFLYSAADDRSVRMWQWSKWNCVHEFVAHDKCVTSVALSADGVLYSGSFDGTVRRWDTVGIAAELRAAEAALAKPPPPKPKKKKDDANRRGRR